MKRLNLTIIATSTLLSGSLLAGPPEYKQVVPPPTPVIYGTGFYGAIDMGANVYQNRGGSRTFTQDNPNLLGFRSEERRVGKECRYRVMRMNLTKKNK